LEYFTPPGSEPPSPSEIDLLMLREWLGDLYRRKLSAVTMRRKLAAVRSFFNFMLRSGTVSVNTAKLVRTPKTPQKLTVVMTAERTNNFLDEIAAGKLERSHPDRDLAIFELLYGCGLRVSELVGLNRSDVDFTE